MWRPTTVRCMQDRELVAAIAAGDPEDSPRLSNVTRCCSTPAAGSCCPIPILWMAPHEHSLPSRAGTAVSGSGAAEHGASLTSWLAMLGAVMRATVAYTTARILLLVISM